MNAMQQALKDVQIVTPLATPQIGSNLQPDSVPSAQPDPVVMAQNDYSADAAKCAKGIIQAAQSRFNAWLSYATTLPNVDAIPDAAKALQTELVNMGFKRAKVETSEWRAFATVYLIEPTRATFIVDSERKIVERDSQGHAIKDSTGADKLRRPTVNEIIEDLRSERDVLIKEGKVPKALVPNAGGKAATTSTNAPKLTATQLGAVLANIQKADESQFGTIVNTIIASIRSRANGKDYASHLVKTVREMQVAQGWVKSKAERKLVPAAQ